MPLIVELPPLSAYEWRADSSAASRALAALVDEAIRGPTHHPDGWPVLTERGARSASAWAQSMRRRVEAVRERDLRGEETWTRRILLTRLQVDAEAYRHWTANTSDLTPYASPIRTASSRLGAMPVRSGAERTLWLERQRALARPLREALANIDIRAARGVRLYAPAIAAVRVLIASYARTDSGAPLLPTAAQLAAIDTSVARSFSDSARANIRQAIAPVVDSLQQALGPSYLAKAPRDMGLWQQPGGPARYRHLIRRYTATSYSPAEIHRIGLAEVARIEREMADERERAGYKGSARAFLDSLLRDKESYAESPEALGFHLTALAERIMPELPRVFSQLPRARGEVRRLDPRLEAVQTFGNYNRPSNTNPVGFYAFNASQLDQRPLLTAASLIYHELYPGHHLQSARQLENPSLPPFRRNGTDVSFSEAWGEYASTVAGELGMYRTLRERYGLLLAQLFTSCRLVVDTSINALGWSSDSARAYLSARVMESPAQIETELLRYGTDYHGQALSYRLGALELLRLREQARVRLGEAFDVREFHEVILTGGQMSLSVLRERLDAWVVASLRASRSR